VTGEALRSVHPWVEAEAEEEEVRDADHKLVSLPPVVVDMVQGSCCIGSQHLDHGMRIAEVVAMRFVVEAFLHQ
jgi:hypothetical protein